MTRFGRPIRRGLHLPATITVPGGEWCGLGDNRGGSDGSRFWGPVRQSWIAGAKT